LVIIGKTNTNWKGGENAMSKQKLKPMPILDIPNVENSKYFWCGSCKHVHSFEKWLENNFKCPSKKCKSVSGLPWEVWRAGDETIEAIPKEGKYYSN
jgi:hypothetical protein